MTSNLDYKKKCSHCKEVLPLDKFYNNKSNIGGKAHECKKCCKERQRKNSEKVNAYQRELYKKNPEMFHKATYKWIANNRKKFNAQQVAHYHKRNGNLKLKSECEICGSSERLVMHHFDYDKPLQVTTLCTKCHLGLHAALKRGKTVLEFAQKRRKQIPFSHV